MFMTSHLSLNVSIASHIKEVEGCVNISWWSGQESDEEAEVIIGQQSLSSDLIEDTL